MCKTERVAIFYRWNSMSVIGLMTNGHLDALGHFKIGTNDDKSLSRPAGSVTFHASLKYIASPPRCHMHCFTRSSIERASSGL